ncbi:hypothetical protein GDO86_014985 [Hymenochirus boettgeri]|uniref:Ethylmalonyl-CoA decarboxylase n=1 Tax=Hymenochirus boettgeri TaxID=247094 RepID=A0A8T2JQU9_9PIPI|nr:hypothetical protein GDO86_014985 [Hymenochirus boettgeri]
MGIYLWRRTISTLNIRWLHCRCLTLYNTANGYDEVKIKEKLSRFKGGSINLSKMDNGIAELKEGMMMCMLMQNTLTRLQRLPLISLAFIQGKALGGGAELSTACDFRLMTDESEVRFVHKQMGLVPGWGGAARLIEIIGSRHALKLLSGSLRVNPVHALELGLADDIISTGVDDSLLEAHKWIMQYTKGSADVNQAVKKVITSGRENILADALRAEKEIFGNVWGGPANLQALAKGTKHK